MTTSETEASTTALDTAELTALVANLEAALKPEHAAQTAALAALRKLVKDAEFRPRSPTWDRELDGTGFEDIPVDVGILTVKETLELLRASQGVVYELVRCRQLPAMHIGNRTRIGRRGLVAFLRGMNADDFDRLIERRVEKDL